MISENLDRSVKHYNWHPTAFSFCIEGWQDGAPATGAALAGESHPHTHMFWGTLRPGTCKRHSPHPLHPQAVYAHTHTSPLAPSTMPPQAVYAHTCTSPLTLAGTPKLDYGLFSKLLLHCDYPTTCVLSNCLQHTWCCLHWVRLSFDSIRNRMNNVFTWSFSSQWFQ